MMEDHATVWGNCLQTIRRNLPSQSFKTWFEPIKPVRLVDKALTIQVPNKFFYDWIEEHYVGLLKTSIQKELGDTARLEYQILMNGNGNHSEIKSKPIEKKLTPPAGTVKTEEIINPFIIPGIRSIKVDPQLNPNFTFDNFIEGDCNKLARNAGLAIAQNPGKTSFNPLVLYGDSGLGKTHLLQAIGNEVLKNHPEKLVLYVPTEKFTNQIITAIKNNAVSDLVNFYALIDVLLVDDIHFLVHKQKTQEIFFQIFNQLHQSRKQIVLSSDKAPKNLEGIEDRLISRFKWGLTADLQSPELETRIAILSSHAQKEGANIPFEVLEFIGYNVKSNVRELEGVVISLMAQAQLNKKAINLDLARDVVQSCVKEFQKEITVENIQKMVADHYAISPEMINGQTRKREVVIARQVAMYLAKKFTEKPLKAIGELFGGRDHSTVIYSCNTVKDMIEVDDSLKEQVIELEKKIKMSFHK